MIAIAMKSLAFGGLLCAAFIAHADDPIVTDRPDFTESSRVVPLGRTQVESGSTWTRADGRSSSLSGPEILIRRSLSSKIELRIGLPNYNWLRTRGERTVKGLDDLYLGFKLELDPLPGGFNLALIPAVVLPVGRMGVRSEDRALDLKLVWSKSLPNDLGLSGMLYYSNPEVDGDRVDGWEHTISLGIPIREKVGMFVEHVLDFSRSSRPYQLLHSGFTFQPDSESQWDLHFGVRLVGPGAESFVGAGYSVRF